MSALHPGLVLPGGWRVTSVEPTLLTLERPVSEDRAQFRKKIGTTLGALACTLALVGHSVIAPELALVELPVALLLAAVVFFGVRSIRDAWRELSLPVKLEVSGTRVSGTLSSRAAVSCMATDISTITLEAVAGIAAKGLQVRLLLKDGRHLVGPEVFDQADAEAVATLRVVAKELCLRTAAPLKERT